jgi:hypothetical protein
LNVSLTEEGWKRGGRPLGRFDPGPDDGFTRSAPCPRSGGIIVTASRTLPIVLRPGIARRIVIVLGGLLMVGMGSLILAAGMDKPLVALLVGGLFLGLGVAGLMAAFKSRLTLDADGFAIRGAFRGRAYRWRDVDGDFRPFRAPTGQGYAVKLVVWNLVPGAKKMTTWRKLNRKFAEESLPAMFGGLNVAELAELMNQVRDDRKAAG